jgi:hypothetical protein
VSGYSLATTRVTVYRGSTDDGYGDEQHRLDPGAVIAKDLPCDLSAERPSTRRSTSQTPRSTEVMTVRMSAAVDQRVPGGGLRVGDLLQDQASSELFAVVSASSSPRAVGRPSPDRVFTLDRLS